MTEAEKQEWKSHRDVKSGTGRSIVVIGTGQAGLATGYQLQEFLLEFVILADEERVGDPWRDLRPSQCGEAPSSLLCLA